MNTNKPKTKIITGCNDCPFLKSTRSGRPTCKIDAEIKILESDILNPAHIGGLKPITPPNCPLKQQSIIITYET